MPKMSHAIEGWLPGTVPLVPPTPVARPLPAAPRLGLWKYRTLRRSRWVVAGAAMVSIGMHAFVLLGFNARKPLPVRARVADEPVIQMVMPDLKEEEVDPVENLNDEAPSEAPAIATPLLADIPSIVPVDAFVQPLDFTPALPANLDAVRLSAVPVNVARSGGGAERLGKIFDVTQLDRQPEPTFQPAPIYPPELKSEYRDTTVVMLFIVTSRGEVVAPSAVSSEHRRFEEAATQAILKWKFRPGYKAGKAVNTRTQISIRFKVVDQ
ncbi:MAG TPA: TonB family protein [Lacunisphaera sp.]|nr:TonB family protein [Lacunisphaera sp.]